MSIFITETMVGMFVWGMLTAAYLALLFWTVRNAAWAVLMPLAPFTALHIVFFRLLLVGEP